jgi:hypothetical protein
MSGTRSWRRHNNIAKTLKMHDIIKSTIARTKLTCKATTIFSELLSHIPIETNIPKYSTR